MNDDLEHHPLSFKADYAILSSAKDSRPPAEETVIVTSDPHVELRARRNADLDRLRAVAIIFVILSHLPLLFPWRNGRSFGINQYFNPWTGVDLFFVISGFIVTKTLLRRLDLARTTEDIVAALKFFFVRRIFRIIPMAWTWALIPLAIAIVFRPTAFPPAASLYREFVVIALNIYNITDVFHFNLGEPGLKNLAPYWSLSIEEQFYLLLPTTMLLVRPVRSRVILGALTFAVITVILRPALIALGTDINFQLKFTLVRFDSLACGVLIYLLSTHRLHQLIEPKVLVNEKVAQIFTGFLFFLLAALPAVFAPERRIGHYTLAFPLINAVCAVLVFIASYNRDYLAFWPLHNRLIGWCASRSYAIYLSHWPMIWITWEIGARITHALGTEPGPRLTFLYIFIFVALTGAASEASHRLVERPMIRRGHAISNRSGCGSAPINHMGESGDNAAGQSQPPPRR